MLALVKCKIRRNYHFTPARLGELLKPDEWY
jgi:hypothetical protein